MGRQDEELTLTVSSYLTDRSGQRFVRVQFERQGPHGMQVAEGLLPEGRIVRQDGYSPDEVEGLESYLKEHMGALLERARTLSDPIRWLE